MDDELRRSLEGQLQILRQRIIARSEADRQLAFIDAELTRIEEQVELIREQAALSTDPEMLSQRIDEIAATLGGTSQWIRDQQQVFGAMEDLLTEPPPRCPGARARETSMNRRPAARVGRGDARPLSLGIGRAVPAARQRLRRRAGAARSCSRCRRFSTRSCSPSYDVVLHYDRSRGVRATRGAEDWTDWLEQALGADGATPCRWCASRARRWS